MKLIFCHIGSPLPPHLLENLVRTAKIFPNIPIHLIKSHEYEITREYQQIPRLEIFEYDSTDSHRALFEQSTLDTKFRRGFWRATLERLIAISEHVISHLEGPFLHVESDVLLMKSFPFKDLQLIKNPTWGFYNEFRDVASLLYIPSSDSAQWLLHKINKELVLNPNHTDMTILKAISNSNRDLVRYFPMGLPFIQNSYSKSSESEREDIFSRTININGLFDSAAIGMWLTGLDPRNNYGLVKYFDMSFINNGDSLVDPSKLKLHFENEFESYFDSQGVKLQIHCLHIHSKNTAIFKQGDIRKMKFMRYFKHGASSKSKFQSTVFFSLLKDSIKNRELVRFVAFAPGFRTVTKNILRCKKILLG